MTDANQVFLNFNDDQDGSLVRIQLEVPEGADPRSFALGAAALIEPLSDRLGFNWKVTGLSDPEEVN